MLPNFSALGAFAGSYDRSLRLQRRPLLAKRAEPFSTTMLFGYAFTGLVVLTLGSVIPTSSLYTELFIAKKDARIISGVLVAAFNVGSAIAQPFQGCLFRCLSLRTIYPLFCAIVLFGGLVAAASYKRSIVTLFVGRLCTGFVAGNLLFEELMDVSIKEKQEQVESIRILVTVVQLAYMSAFLIAALALHVAPLETSNEDVFPLNALTWPYYISSIVAGILLVLSIAILRPGQKGSSGSTEAEEAIGLDKAILGLIGMGVSFGAPGLFVVSGFVLNLEYWEYSLVDLSLIIAGLYFLSALTVFGDNVFKSWHKTLMFAIPILLLGVVPWKGVTKTFSFTIYCICKPLLNIASRVTFANANGTVLQYAKQRGKDGAADTNWIVLSGVALELGLGISLSFATLFAPEPTGALIVIGLALLYAIVITIF